MPDRRVVLIVAGEESADRYGGALVRRLAGNPSGPGIRFFGAGGEEMQRAGVELLGHIRDLASIGPREALSHMPRYFDLFRALLGRCRQSPPAVAVLMDFPEFNLRLAARLKRLGIPVIYYIGPQLWAWRQGRIRQVRRSVDRMLVILPFEEDYYRARGVAAEFVGHPLLEDFAPVFDRERYLGALGLNPEKLTVAVLPGSRRKEIDHMLPTLLQAAKVILGRRDAQVLVSAAPTVGAARVERIAAGVPGRDWDGRMRVVAGNSRDLLANADFGFVKSGTSTLEAALVGTPFLVTYKLSRGSWMLGRILVRSRFKGLVNLIAGELVVPELLQDSATPEALAATALQYLDHPAKAATMRLRLQGIREKLGARCASETVAGIVQRCL